ncbi:MAG: hypothetical protein MK319_10470, partial [Pseudomonadales bacterium]|nr:hypothetical protein [Pseudomonadales bacterium]
MTKNPMTLLVLTLLHFSLSQLLIAQELEIASPGSVGFSDFLDFALAFGSTDTRFDIDESGSVDFGDFLRFVSVFGNTT